MRPYRQVVLPLAKSEVRAWSCDVKDKHPHHEVCWHLPVASGWYIMPVTELIRQDYADRLFLSNPAYMIHNRLLFTHIRCGQWSLLSGLVAYKDGGT